MEFDSNFVSHFNLKSSNFVPAAARYSTYYYDEGLVVLHRGVG